MWTHVRHLSGGMRCVDCRLTWTGTWALDVPALVCHECGGTAVQEGPQQAETVGELALLSEMFQIERQAVLRTMS